MDKYTQGRKISLLERAAQIRESDDLLNMDDEIAFAKATTEDIMERFSRKVDLYERTIMVAAEQGEYDEVGGPPSFMEFVGDEFPTELIKMTNQLVTTSYNMKFARRFSIPVTELEGIIAQVAGAFKDMCEMFELPEAAMIMFQTRMRGLKISRQMGSLDQQMDRQVNRQLMRAGGVLDEVAPMTVEELGSQVHEESEAQWDGD